MQTTTTAPAGYFRCGVCSTEQSVMVPTGERQAHAADAHAPIELMDVVEHPANPGVPFIVYDVNETDALVTLLGEDGSESVARTSDLAHSDRTFSERIYR